MVHRITGVLAQVRPERFRDGDTEAGVTKRESGSTLKTHCAHPAAQRRLTMANSDQGKPQPTLDDLAKSQKGHDKDELMDQELDQAGGGLIDVDPESTDDKHKGIR